MITNPPPRDTGELWLDLLLGLSKNFKFINTGINILKKIIVERKENNNINK